MGSDDGDGQSRLSREAVDAVQEFLGGPRPDGDGWMFEFGEHLESNWGAVYGGALAAGTMSIARCVAPDGSPRSLHIQIVRSVPRGIAYATVKMRHAGRTVGTVEVDLFDARRKLAAIALVTMVTPTAVASGEHDTGAEPFRGEPIEPASDAWTAPIVEALDMFGTGFVVENARLGVDGTRTFGMSMRVPWDHLDVTGPEVACLGADAVIGAPMTERFGFDGVAGPNVDLTLRFSTAPATRIFQPAATLLSIQHGTATVGIEVQAADQQLAHGLATSLLLTPS